MTEEEAKEKLCPEKMLNNVHRSRAYCHGSDCMAWRWMKTLDIKGRPAVDYGGYCGLAGDQ